MPDKLPKRQPGKEAERIDRETEDAGADKGVDTGRKEQKKK